MGASDLTTDTPETEAVGDGSPSPAHGANGHVAKKRKKQKALAAAAANGHVAKVAKPEAAAANGNGNGRAKDPAETNGAVSAPEESPLDEVEAEAIAEVEELVESDDVAE